MRRMKTTYLLTGSGDERGTVIATFGQAALVKRADGGYALAGGSPEDRIEAQEWISLFAHEVVPEKN